MQTDMYTVINPESGMIIYEDHASGGYLCATDRIVRFDGNSMFNLKRAEEIKTDLSNNRFSHIKNSEKFVVAKIVLEPLKEN